MENYNCSVGGRMFTGNFITSIFSPHQGEISHQSKESIFTWSFPQLNFMKIFLSVCPVTSMPAKNTENI